MASFDIETFRQQSKLFQLLDGSGQERLVALAREECFPDGHTLMREGDGGQSFYVVLIGALRVLIAGNAGPREVAQLGPGAFVGEIAALMNEPRSATVVTVGQTSCLRFDAPPIQDLLKEYPTVRQALVKLALKRSEDNLAEMIKDGDD